MNPLSFASWLSFQLRQLRLALPCCIHADGARSHGASSSRRVSNCACSHVPRVAIALLLASCNGPPEAPPERVIENQGGVSEALNTYLRENSVAEDNSFLVEYVDLNNDKVDDALVLMQGFDWCGVSGCTLLVFRGLPAQGYFEFVSAVEQVRAPIIVSEERAETGWNNLVVASQVKGRPADMSIAFDGQTYPREPAAGKAIGGMTQVKGQQVF